MALTLRHLSDETWGQRFARARAEADLSLREAVEKIGYLRDVSTNTISRLEKRPTAPTKRHQRHTAYVASLAYGIDPSDFGLTDADRPSWVTDEVVIALKRSTRWLTAAPETVGGQRLRLVQDTEQP